MKQLIFGVILAAASTVASADSLSGEVRFFDVPSGSNATEYKVEYGTTLSGMNLSFEANSKQEQDEGRLTGKYSVKAGPALSPILGLTPSISAELGQSLSDGDNFAFVGYAVGLSRELFSDVTLNTGYRYRQELEGNRDESRYNVGLSFAFSDDFSAGVQYYRTNADTDSNSVGIVLKRQL